ncbi:unnamed protein product [Trifolium pratense]|uniref:Uncharacterized protein n=1 Tax=Trifolium pratense TaxID=57577 RepID=A0ACB0KFZ2_TRIPR|nr:unnamed protein product [Trifolium pratense]
MKNMAQILMFVYASMIMFLSLFLIVTSGARIPCLTDDDCPIADLPIVMKCIDNFCRFDLVVLDWCLGRTN